VEVLAAIRISHQSLSLLLSPPTPSVKAPHRDKEDVDEIQPHHDLCFQRVDLPVSEYGQREGHRYGEESYVSEEVVFSYFERLDEDH
jgi:hypothetical protein